ncbi:hypothetical protein OS493_032407 [Desmophyllum pertusum]|uniref:Uncharacterized protein n=1 Tax=Desmophyllum pertusum TaxID=174260 RepID=A0A9W9Y882_9CNID|nr:hypothetical protein OS493_032407 [Desmophyllum pertusum]
MLLESSRSMQQRPPPDADQVSMTVQFLEATQSLFEFGILSHAKILDASSPVLNNMEDGFLFFVAWADYCYGEGYNLATPAQTVFLAWQEQTKHMENPANLSCTAKRQLSTPRGHRGKS